MRRTRETTALFALATTLTLAGCFSSLPTDPASDQDPFFTVAPAPGFDAMRRTAPLPAARSITRTIGAEGGRLELEDVGVAFVIPAEALSEATEITLTALAGDAVAFEFAPHGLVFERPASIHVRARGTEVEEVLQRPELDGAVLEDVLGVYFEGDATAGVEPLETIPVRLIDEAVVFPVHHFSGYVCASG